MHTSLGTRPKSGNTSKNKGKSPTIKTISHRFMIEVSIYKKSRALKSKIIKLNMY